MTLKSHPTILSVLHDLKWVNDHDDLPYFIRNKYEGQLGIGINAILLKFVSLNEGLVFVWHYLVPTFDPFGDLETKFVTSWPDYEPDNLQITSTIVAIALPQMTPEDIQITSK